MEQVLVNESSLQDIANAIREKTGGTEPILPSEMSNVIRAIEMGGELKSASGTAKSRDGTTFTVTGLAFKPQCVLVVISSGANLAVRVACVTPGQSVTACTNGSGGYIGESLTPTLSDGGFTLSLRTSSIAKFASSKTYNWYAYGV